METNLTEIQKMIETLAKQIEVPQYLLPKYNNAQEGSHIEIDRKGSLYYFETERGQENVRYLAKDVDDLLYKVFLRATLMMAANYGSKHRIKGQDSRRVWFVEQERLLGVLNEEWRLRNIKSHEEILIEHPFDDNASERATYYQQLIQGQQHLGNESTLAYEKYPVLNKFNP